MPGSVDARCIETIVDTSSCDIDEMACADIPPIVDEPPAVPCPRRFADAHENPTRGLIPRSRGIWSVRTPNVASAAGLSRGRVPGFDKPMRTPPCSCQASVAFHSSPIQSEDCVAFVFRGVLVRTRSYVAGRLAARSSIVRYVYVPRSGLPGK